MKTTLEMHIHQLPGEVVRTDEIVDVGCGKYPCYYVQKDSEVWVSTSAASLIGELGSLNRNPDFVIPEFINSLSGGTGDSGSSESTAPVDKVTNRLPRGVKSFLPSEIGSFLRKIGLLSSPPLSPWYKSWDTIDKRVYRIRPFETVTPTNVERSFEPTYSLNNPEEVAQKTAEHMTKFVNNIENEFPNHEHIILTGGTDSQLISLVPKKTENWHIFSAEPNYPLVKDFVENNNINVNNMYHHDNRNRESLGDLQTKLLSSDLLVDPRHIRYVKRLAEITDEFDSECILWNGGGGGEILQHRPHLSYPETFLTRFPSMQGLSSQTFLNFTGCPSLSPYCSPEIWREVFLHFNPAMMSEGMDIRPQIGDILYNDDVWWPDRNPGPSLFEYNINVHPIELFISGMYNESGIGHIEFPLES